ncbi:hypothetical protein C8Q74DRAFT_1219384 [Fomes fomentarius]|nr:hypothetical protein C8Q74DRAFT_1219384 [Fomes fomentarius]
MRMSTRDSLILLHELTWDIRAALLVISLQLAVHMWGRTLSAFRSGLDTVKSPTAPRPSPRTTGFAINHYVGWNLECGTQDTAEAHVRVLLWTSMHASPSIVVGGSVKAPHLPLEQDLWNDKLPSKISIESCLAKYGSFFDVMHCADPGVNLGAREFGQCVVASPVVSVRPQNETTGSDTCDPWSCGRPACEASLVVDECSVRKNVDSVATRFDSP